MKRWAGMVLPAEKAKRNLQQELPRLHHAFLTHGFGLFVSPAPYFTSSIKTLPDSTHTLALFSAHHVSTSLLPCVARRPPETKQHPTSAAPHLVLPLPSPACPPSTCSLPFPHLADLPFSLVQPCLELQKASAELYSRGREMAHR